MEKATSARNQIGPLLEELIAHLDAEGSATQTAFYKRIRGELYQASDHWDLAEPILALTAGPVIGLQLSQTADALVNRILQKVRLVIADLNGEQPTIH